MRWLMRVLGGRRVQQDPVRQEALLHDVRYRFGANGHVPDQVDGVARLLDGDDGLVVAARVVREFADGAHAELLAQAAEVYRRTGRRLPVDRRDYRSSWRAAGPELRWSLFALPCGFHPYVHVAAAVTVVGAGAPRFVRLTDPKPLLTHLYEMIDLCAAGWEQGRVPVDTHAVRLVTRLILTAQQINAAMDDPPRLPPPIRQLMRRNDTVDVHDGSDLRVVGTVNLGAELRSALLA